MKRRVRGARCPGAGVTAGCAGWGPRGEKQVRARARLEGCLVGRGEGGCWGGGRASGRSLARSPAALPSLRLPPSPSPLLLLGGREQRGGGGQAEEAGWRPAGVDNRWELHCSSLWCFLPPAPTEAMINKTVGQEASCGCLRARLEPLEKKRGREREREGASGGGGGGRGEEEGSGAAPARLGPRGSPCEERRAGGEPAGGAGSAACQLTAALVGLFVFFLLLPSVFSLEASR